MFKRLTAMTVGALCLGLVACRPPALEKMFVPSIVGTWLVKIPEAPFPWHPFIFHSDGTVQQSNPDAGDPNTSDSNLIGHRQALSFWLAYVASRRAACEAFAGVPGAPLATNLHTCALKEHNCLV
jgi:hypothetical protein